MLTDDIQNVLGLTDCFAAYVCRVVISPLPMRHLVRFLEFFWATCSQQPFLLPRLVSIQDTFANEVKILKQLVSAELWESSARIRFFIEFLKDKAFHSTRETVSPSQPFMQETGISEAPFKCSGKLRQMPSRIPIQLLLKAILLDTFWRNNRVGDYRPGTGLSTIAKYHQRLHWIWQKKAWVSCHATKNRLIIANSGKASRGESNLFPAW